METTTKPGFSERMQALDELCAFLKPRLGNALRLGRTNPGETPPTFVITKPASDEEPILSFGLIDTIYFWTFDGGVSCHYSRDKELMKRTIAMELTRSEHLSQPS